MFCDKQGETIEYFNTKKTHIKDIFLDQDNWKNFFIKHAHNIRSAIVKNVAKLLICGSSCYGYRVYHCSKCDFIKKVTFSCKSKSCSSCGKKATDAWITKNYYILPKTSWQNITFTLPSELWPLFWCDRDLMNILPKYAAKSILKIAAKKGAIPGIFLAIHSFGRDLKRNFHLHLVTTCGGVTFNHNSWIKLYFHHQTVKTLWKNYVIKILRKRFKAGLLSFPENLEHLQDQRAFNEWINAFYEKKWVVHLSKPTKNHKQNINYLGRYLKRPPLSEANILYYDSNKVTLRHLDHSTKSYTTFTMTVNEFIARFISHIPDENFRSIRYYGWLANRVRTKMLALVNKLLGLKFELIQDKVSWVNLFIKEFGVNPLVCPKCLGLLVLIGANFRTKLKEFIANHYMLINKETIAC